MVEIEFTADFGGRKKGEKITCDSMLASHLIRVDKVAKVVIASKAAVSTK